MNVLLLCPEFPDTFWSFKHALHFIRQKASSPPLCLLTVAAMLPVAWRKRLLDRNLAALHSEDDAREANYQHVKAFLREYLPPRIKSPLHFKYLAEQALALLRSIFHLGLLGQERVQY